MRLLKIFGPTLPTVGLTLPTVGLKFKVKNFLTVCSNATVNSFPLLVQFKILFLLPLK